MGISFPSRPLWEVGAVLFSRSVHRAANESGADTSHVRVCACVHACVCLGEKRGVRSGEEIVYLVGKRGGGSC